MGVIYGSISIGLSISKLVIDLVKNRSNGDINRSNQIIIDYVRLVRSDIDSLMHVYFRGAIENLNYALTASDDNKRDYLLQARSRFIDALTIEVNENLLLSHLGLALCQHLLGDEVNCIKTLERVKNINYIPNNDEVKVKKMVLSDIGGSLLFYLVNNRRLIAMRNEELRFPELPLITSFVEEYESELKRILKWHPRVNDRIVQLWHEFIAKEFNEIKTNIINQLTPNTIK